MKALSAVQQKFILHWGEMGTRWGINRTVAQIHALLYVSATPMTAEDIAAALGVARSNVSSSIRELLAWNLVRRVPVKGDRRDHFEAECDIWELVARIAAGRKAREIDPALAALKACVAEAGQDADTEQDPSARQLPHAKVLTQRGHGPASFAECNDPIGPLTLTIGDRVTHPKFAVM